MKFHFAHTLALTLALLACGGTDENATEPEPRPGAQEPAPHPEWPELFSNRVEETEGAVVMGREGWLYFKPELRHLAAGRYWGEAAREASQADDPKARDPLPAILDFKAQLDRAGIELLFVPVPAKAAVYPQYLPGVDSGVRPSRERRVDAVDREFLELLESEGIEVLDLAPLFFEARNDGSTYCQQDTHWSPRGVEIAARAIAERIAGRDWIESIPKLDLETRQETVEITGDLWRELSEPRPEKERLEVTVVDRETAQGLMPVEPDRDSPLLLLGDSHALVFHAGGDLHARGAGLADHLAHELGFAVDLVAVRGSGATPARVNLLRRRDQLAGKKLVVWCLSIRETTEGQGWKKVPIIPEAARRLPGRGAGRARR